MGKTLFGSLGKAAATFANKTPVSFAPPGSGRRTGFAGGLTRPAGQTAQMRAQGSNSTLYAIVDRIITSYSQVEWHLYRKAASGKAEDRVEVTSHAALDLWGKPNKFMTGPMFREAGQQHEELTGEQWWVIAHDERFKQLPLELWPVRPDRMDPIPDAEDFIVGFVYRSPNGEQVPLNVEDVVFQRRPNPMDPYRGVGVVQTILVDLDATRASAEWNRAFFLNSAEPGGIVQVEKRLSDDEFNEFRDRWAEQHRGVNNAHRVGVLENGLQWVDRKYSMRDMQFTELRDVAREIIREAFGMPKPMLGAVDDVNRANAEAAGFVFAEWLIKPRLRRVKEILNTRILPMYGRLGEGLEFDFDDPTPENREADSNELTARANAVKALVEAGAYGPAALSAVGLPEIAFGSPDADPDRELLIKLVTAAPAALASKILPMLGYDVPEDPAPAAPPVAPAPSGDEPTDGWDEAVSGLLGRAPSLRNSTTDPLEQMQQDHEAALDALLTNLASTDDDWIDQLGDQIEQAIDDDDTAALANLTLDSADAADTIRTALGVAAQQAADRMADEAREQGVTVAAPKVDESLTARLRPGQITCFGDELTAIATAVATLIASGLAASAAQEAVRRFLPGVSGTTVANAVKGKLRQLKGVFKRDQLGGAIHRAQNTGRIATLEAAPTARWVASEKNDGNTCAPCRAIDGTNFTTLADVTAAYGAGPYHACEGGIRCRGTVTAFWDTTGAN